MLFGLWLSHQMLILTLMLMLMLMQMQMLMLYTDQWKSGRCLVVRNPIRQMTVLGHLLGVKGSLDTNLSIIKNLCGQYFIH